MCLNLCVFSAILLGILYLWFGAFELVFENNHGFELWQTGLSFLGVFVGILIAIATEPLFHRNYLRLVHAREQNGGEFGRAEPEVNAPRSLSSITTAIESGTH